MVNTCCLTAGWGHSARARLLVSQAECRPDSLGENPFVGISPACLNPLYLARNRGRIPVSAPGPYFFPGHSASVGVGDLLGILVHGKMHGSLGSRESIQFEGHDPRDPLNLD